jgi:hypothetical protein
LFFGGLHLGISPELTWILHSTMPASEAAGHRPTQSIVERALELEEDPEHLGDGEDHLAK